MLTGNSFDASIRIEGVTAGGDLVRWIRTPGSGVLGHAHDCLMYHAMRG
jgi:hypothetical protein